MKLIVFDWDGTLADSTTMIVGALQRSCADLQLPVPTARQASYVIGLGLRDTLMTVAPTLTEDRYPEMVAAFRRNFLEGEHDIGLFDGAREMLADLNARGALLGVATGKSRPGLNRAMQHLGIEKEFVVTRCADEGHPKPNPEMLHYVINAAGVPHERAVMIGDTTHDLQLAKNAGVASIAVAYGAHTPSDFEHYAPLTTAHSISELHQYLIQWLTHE
jgi:phosphoglycolate phosphatase